METNNNVEVYDFKIGDTVGNTVQGFVFEVLEMENKLHGLKVKNLETGEVINTTFENMYKKQSDNTEVNIDEVEKKYSSVIADIYAEHHVSPFTDIEKHNEGIIKAMVDFAIFYKENS